MSLNQELTIEITSQRRARSLAMIAAVFALFLVGCKPTSDAANEEGGSSNATEHDQVKGEETDAGPSSAGSSNVENIQAKKTQKPTPKKKPSDEEERERIVEVFKAYRAATLLRDGEAAVDHVNSQTLDHYDRVLKQTIEVYDSKDPEVVKKATIGDRVMMTQLLTRVGPERLKNMSARDLYVLGIGQGWIGLNTFKNGTLGELTVTKNTLATGPIRLEGELTKAQWQFVKEKGVWKIDVRSLMTFADRELRAYAKAKGLTESELVAQIVETMPAIVPVDTWQTFEDEKAGFRVRFPEKPKRTEKETNPTKGGLTHYTASSLRGANYLVSFSEVAPTKDLEEARAIVNRAAAGLMDGVQGEPAGEVDAEIDGRPSKIVQLKLKDGILMTAQITLANQKLYTVAVTTHPKADASLISAFFQSFQVLP